MPRQPKLSPDSARESVGIRELLDIGSRWKESEARTDQITGKPKGKRVVYVVENFKRCDGEPMVRYSRHKHGSQREWIMPIANFTARYAPMSNDKGQR